MAKEVLKISPTRVQVDYDFRNDSDQDVTTEVAFPIPPFTNGPNDRPVKDTSFSDFLLTVNGQPVKYQTEARAFLSGREVTSVLNSEKIDIPSFGHWDWKHNFAPEFSRLSKREQNKLVQLGLFFPDDSWGNWTVRLQYHWTQTFPAHSTVHIHHEYTPVVGYELMPRNTIRKLLHQPPVPPLFEVASAEDVKLLNSFCPDTSFLRALDKSMAAAQSEGSDYVPLQWVDFILTSANTWKQPIEDFTLIVERGNLNPGDNTLVSFCAPERTRVTKLDANHFQVHLTDFIPRSELRIGFFDIPKAAANREAGK